MRSQLQAALAVIVTGTALLVPARSGDPAELDQRALSRIERPPLGLPVVPIPEDNAPTPAKIRLGRKLFFDRRLSNNGTLSCGMCHVPEQGFTVNEIRTSVGNQGKTLRRNAPTLLNVAYAAPFFHDGREPVLDLQPFDVFLNPDEMAASSLGALVEKVKSLPDYAEPFEEAFGEPPAVERIGQAIASYSRTLLSANSAFDRRHYANDTKALNASAERGLSLFVGKAGCVTCHEIGKEHALFTNRSFHDTGIGWYNSTVESKSREPVAVELAPGVVTRVPRSAVESVGEPFANDLGRYEATGDPADRWRFKTPTLRNVAVTAPYMHDGSFSTLREVVEFYNGGAHPHEGLDSAVRPLGLDDHAIDDLVAFLQSLTGDNLDELIRDARSQAVGNP
jgi:cytochrome c peroxidase